MPKYIYYTGNYNEWKERSKGHQGCMFRQYEKKADFIQYDFDDNDLDNEEGSLWYFEKKKENKSVDSDNGNSNIDSSSNNNDKDENIIELVKGLKLEVAILKDLVTEIKNAKNN